MVRTVFVSLSAAPFTLELLVETMFTVTMLNRVMISVVTRPVSTCLPSRTKESSVLSVGQKVETTVAQVGLTPPTVTMQFATLTGLLSRVLSTIIRLSSAPRVVMALPRCL